MNWDFFEELADIPREERLRIMSAHCNNSGAFRKLFESAPNREQLDKIRGSIREYKERNDK